MHDLSQSVGFSRVVLCALRNQGSTGGELNNNRTQELRLTLETQLTGQDSADQCHIDQSCHKLQINSTDKFAGAHLRQQCTQCMAQIQLSF
jgi:hypothetical protein